jgi:CRISPR-associated endonuclease Csn1
MEHRRYRVGIDVGLNSVGLAAVEIDDNGHNLLGEIPISILNAQSVIHDGGVDPEQAKSSTSRRATAGVARRTRKLYKRRRNRLEQLDILLQSLGFPIEDVSRLSKGTSPYVAWKIRGKLVDQYIAEEDIKKRLISLAVRHIARHRGWRNPYGSVQQLGDLSEVPSEFLIRYAKTVNREVGQRREGFHFVDLWREKHDDGSTVTKQEMGKQPLIQQWSDAPINGRTVAQLVVENLNPETKIRRSQEKGNTQSDVLNLQMQKLHQSDFLHELKVIFERQQIDAVVQKKLIHKVFEAVNPRHIGAAASLVGKDPLDPMHARAGRGTIAYQEYRVMATIDTLKIKQAGVKRNLTLEERQFLFDFLCGLPAKAKKDQPSIDTVLWTDVADALGIERVELAWVGGSTEDGEPISAKKPPVVTTNYVVERNAPKQVASWWSAASNFERDRFVESLSNAGAIRDDSSEAKQADAKIDAVLEELDEQDMAKLESLKIPSGRAAYSAQTLRKITLHMYDTEENRIDSLQTLFGVDSSWTPPAPAIYEPTGNPSVDRTLKIIHRWLLSMNNAYGKPESVNIEYARDGLKSVAVQKSEQRERDARYANNLQIAQKYDSSASGHDIRRIRAIQRQNSNCAYCGNTITFATCQMDHILPRKGVGSDSTFSNLVAVCEQCNKEKNNRLFSAWATNNSRVQMDDVMERIDKQWIKDSWMDDKRWRQYKEDVKLRLSATEESEPLDNRSMESVAYMARELRARISGFYQWSTKDESESQQQRVFVSSGDMTAFARRTPFENPLEEGSDTETYETVLPWLDHMSRKTRFDRRHHAVDACAIALMRPQIVRILTQAEELRNESRDEFRRGQIPEDRKRSTRYWKNWRGEPGTNDNIVFNHWAGEQLKTLSELVAHEMSADNIPVIYPTRLRLGNGSAHQDTVMPMMKRKVSDALSMCAINKASSPALYTALVRDPDFDRKTGLPENLNRRLRIHDKWLGSSADIEFLEPAVSVNLTRNTRDVCDPGELDKNKNTSYIPVRGGVAEAGNSIHHVRFYRIPKVDKRGDQTGESYAMLRVLMIDMSKYQYDKQTGVKQNLFQLPLPEESYSRRFCDQKLRNALIEGNAEYLGWAVSDDELEIPAFADKRVEFADASTPIDKLLYSFPGTYRFRFRGFNKRDKLKISPTQMASEGLLSQQVQRSGEGQRSRSESFAARQLRTSKYSADYAKAIDDTLKGYEMSVNVLLGTYGARVIHRKTDGTYGVRFSTVQG